jgi:ribosome maturation factor RimP
LRRIGIWKDRLTDIRLIERLIGPSLEGMGFRLIRVTFGAGHRPVLQVMAEPLDGTPMTIDHCTDVSRAVSALLDVEDPIPGNYDLEVSSPGIDRPLVSRDDFRRFAGFEARIELARPVDGRKRFRGRIKPIDDDDRVVIVEAAETVAVPFEDILKAKLVLTDELLAAAETGRVAPPSVTPDQ